MCVVQPSLRPTGSAPPAVIVSFRSPRPRIEFCNASGRCIVTRCCCLCRRLAGGPPITLAARGACWPCERDALPMTGGTAAPTSQGTTRRSAAGARTSRAFRYCRPGRAALPRSTRPIRHPPQQFQIDICYRAPIPLPEDRARPTNGSDRGEHDLTLVVEHVVSYG